MRLWIDVATDGMIGILENKDAEDRYQDGQKCDAHDRALRIATGQTYQMHLSATTIPRCYGRSSGAKRCTIRSMNSRTLVGKWFRLGNIAFMVNSTP